MNLYINLRRSRDCLCVSVVAGGRRPAAFVCLCHRAASFTYFGDVFNHHMKCVVRLRRSDWMKIMDVLNHGLPRGYVMHAGRNSVFTNSFYKTELILRKWNTKPTKINLHLYSETVKKIIILIYSNKKKTKLRGHGIYWIKLSEKAREVQTTQIALLITVPLLKKKKHCQWV